jgi:hypothetical protein
MKKQRRNRLSISGETLRHLGAVELGHAVGAGPPPPTSALVCPTRVACPPLPPPTSGCVTELWQGCTIIQ